MATEVVLLVKQNDFVALLFNVTSILIVNRM
jgi:hypothetical protein